MPDRSEREHSAPTALRDLICTCANRLGRHGCDVLAERILAAPIEQRMEAMGMAEGPCLWCGNDRSAIAPDSLCDDDERHYFGYWPKGATDV